MTGDEVIFLLLNLQRKKNNLDKNFRFRFRFGTIVAVFLVYRSGKALQVVKRQNVYQKKR